MTKKKTIKERVLGEIFDDWDDVNKGVIVARDKLKKMFMIDYPKLKYEAIEEKRLILYNLAVSEIEIGYSKGLKIYEMESVKLYLSILKNEMDKFEGYKEGDDTACLYVRVLTNYIESHKKELTKEELIKNYELCYKIYEKYEDKNENGCICKLMAKFNMYMTIGNFNMLLDILEEIHNSDDPQYKKSFNELVDEIKETNNFFYQRVQLLLKQNIKLKII